MKQLPASKNFFIFYMPFCLIIWACCISLFQPNITFITKDQYDLLSNISFFNQTHVLLTFFLILGTKSYRQWLCELKIYNTSFIIIVLLFFLGSFLLTEAIYFNVFKIGYTKGMEYYFLLMSILGTQHFLYQSFGISAFITKGALLKDGNNPNIKNQLNIEHKYLKYLYLAYIITLIAVAFVKNETYKNIFYGATAILASFVLFKIFKEIIKLPKPIKSKKLIFCFRYFLYPFKILSNWIGFVALVIHGWEYIYFINQSFKEENKSSRLPHRQFFIFLVAQIIFIIPLLLMNSDEFKTNFEVRGTIGYSIVKGLVNALVLTHFFLDRFPFSPKYNPKAHQQEKFTHFAKEIYA